MTKRLLPLFTPVLRPVFDLLLLFFLTACGGCSHWGSKSQTCNPLGGLIDEDCFLPYPTSFYTKADPSSLTGNRVNLTDAALPTSLFGEALDPALYNHRDGFSSAGVLLANFPNEIDPASLRLNQVQVFDWSTGSKIPVLVELDANANSSKEKQAIIIQPKIRLKPRTRYVVMVDGIMSARGERIAPLSGFKRLRDNQVEKGSRLEKEVAKFEEIFSFLSKKGIKRENLQLAWDFSTGSDESTVGRMVKMRDQAFGAIETSRGIHLTTVEDSPKEYPELLRRLVGTINIPSFLENGDGDRLLIGPDGEPFLGQTADFPITIHIPSCAKDATRPLPIVIYGHGTFNSAENEMQQEDNRKLINELCVIQVGTDWLGRAKSDRNYFIFKIIPNWNNFLQMTDRLQQAHVNFSFVARLIGLGVLNNMPELKIGKKTLVDPSRIYYYGISEGGCQGVTALALSPDIQRGAMNVPCGYWSRFFWRSSDFYYTRRAMQWMYPSPIELQKLMALSQLQWDYTDPANYGEHILRDPLSGSRDKKILYQEAINDASVPNLVTRTMARTIGLKLLEPNVESVEGIDQVRGPADSAYVQYDIGVLPRLGENNVPPPKSEVHERVRRLSNVHQQLKEFLKEDGKVYDTCGGHPCVFPFKNASM